MAERKKLNLGYSDFKHIIENDNYYVDKSMLIEEVINSEKAVVLLPRPRRFGKTMNISMLRYFFDSSMPENKNLFKNLQIWQTGDDIKQHCCNYPVIYTSFKDAKGNSWEQTYKLLKRELANLCRNYDYLLDSEAISKYDKADFEMLIDRSAPEVDYQGSLAFLSGLLSKHHNKKVVILVDEYDTPIQSGYKTYYDDVITFMRGLLSGAFKDNHELHKGVITGILRVSRESIFSGLNNITVHSILDNRFSDKFGFTEPEVKQILDDFQLADKYEDVKKWYNGYKFGKTEDIYNPWSILNFVSEPDTKFKTYWTQTSANDLIKNEIKKKDAEIIRQDISTLMNNQTLERIIEENFVFPDLQSNKDLLWSLLAYSGYLTIIEEVKYDRYKLKIPNYEIKHVFTKTILEWLQTDVKVRHSLLIETTNHLTANNLEEFEKGFKQIMGDTFSYYDTAKANEYVYHSYLLGLLAVIGDDYIIKSNRESGEGRYDILLIPHDKTKYGVVIELKQIEKQKDTENNEEFINRINNEIKTAVRQIETKQYYKELLDSQIPKENIVKVPVVFAGKEPFVVMQK